MKVGQRALILAMFVMQLFLLSGECFALWGKVVYPDGSPAAGAHVSISPGQGTGSLVCDSEGRFQFDPLPGLVSAKVEVIAPDGKDYQPVVLPVGVFESGDAVIVLEPK